MASISNDPNGRRRILFIDGNGNRKVIRLGKVSRRYAESVKAKIEDLVSASITSDAPRDDTARWLTDLDTTMHDKLSASAWSSDAKPPRWTPLSTTIWPNGWM